MLITKQAIAGMIPHAGAMCLLDGVLSWDEAAICCLARSHRSPDNPLRVLGTLNAVCGIEYAAQAMAVHGRLSGVVDCRPQIGYLASVRQFVSKCDRLDLLAGDLLIDAERLHQDEGRVIYRFALRCDGAEVASGRAAVILEVARS
jgi:predicted hotdog family 3-hydroxylacyl-ACP dehydratase